MDFPCFKVVKYRDGLHAGRREKGKKMRNKVAEPSQSARDKPRH